MMKYLPVSITDTSSRGIYRSVPYTLQRTRVYDSDECDAASYTVHRTRVYDVHVHMQRVLPPKRCTTGAASAEFDSFSAPISLHGSEGGYRLGDG
jgi:hypothetical protein